MSIASNPKVPTSKMYSWESFHKLKHFLCNCHPGQVPGSLRNPTVGPLQPQHPFPKINATLISTTKDEFSLHGSIHTHTRAHTHHAQIHARTSSVRAHTPVRVHHALHAAWCVPRRVWLCSEAQGSGFLLGFRLCCSVWLYLVLSLYFLRHRVNVPRVCTHLSAHEPWVASSLVTNAATMKILTHGSAARVFSLLPKKAFLGNKVFLCSAFRDLANRFYKMVVTVFTPPSRGRALQLRCSWPRILTGT